MRVILFSCSQVCTAHPCSPRYSKRAFWIKPKSTPDLECISQCFQSCLFFLSGWHLNVFESATENTKSVFVLRTGEWENFVVSKMPCVVYSIAHIWVGNLSQKLYTSRGKPIILSDTKATTARFWSVPIGLKNYNWRMSTLRAIFQIFSFHMNEPPKKRSFSLFLI